MSTKINKKSLPIWQGLMGWVTTSFYFYNDQLHSTQVIPSLPITERKTEVTIKELRNILAVEYLKEGDVVVLETISGKAIVKIKSMEGIRINVDLQLFIDEGDRYSSGHEKLGESNFIRYATEGDKALLHGEEPNPELEVGKWYKYPHIENWKLCITYVGSDAVKGYGLDTEEGWMTDWKGETNADSLKDLVECSPQEVEQALIKEAKKRYKVGDKVTQLRDYYYGDSSNIIEDVTTGFSSVNKIIGRANNGFFHCLFKDGKWAEVVKEETFLSSSNKIKVAGEDLKITDRDIATIEVLHDALLDNHGYNLEASMLKNARALTHKLRQLI